MFINVNDNIKELNNKLNYNKEVKELVVSVSGNIAIAPSVSCSSVGENTVCMSERSMYADTIDVLSDYEKELICQITFCEAGNQCVEGQRAVVEVILNRVLSELYPNTVEEVLSQTGQFSTYKGRKSVSQDSINNMMLIIDEVYEKEPVLTEEYLYFNSLTSPGLNNPIKIEDHWFGTQ